MFEWRPELLPVGSSISVVGNAGADMRKPLRDLVSRMHERYDECIVYSASPEDWVGMWCRVTNDTRQINALLCPGPPRLVVLHNEGLGFAGSDEVRQRLGITIISAHTRTQCRCDGSTYVFMQPSLWSQCDHPRIKAMGAHEGRIRMIESLEAHRGYALVVTPTDEAWYRVDPSPPQPWWSRGRRSTFGRQLGRARCPRETAP
jgi:hypothetical protein